MIAIVAALPRELALLTRGWNADKRHYARGFHVWTRGNAVAVAAGMGPSRAALAVEAAMAAGDVTALWSVGLAGACHAGVAAGAVLDCGLVIDARTGERFGTDGPTLVSDAAVASVREKSRLRAAYGADAVDMEAATVARLAAAHGVGFRAIKAISDEHGVEIAGLDRFRTRHGHFHTRAFALHTAVRPHTWARTVRLGRSSAMALKRLSAMVAAELG